MNGYHSQVLLAIKAAGFTYKRPGKGSHDIYANGAVSVSVPYKILSTITANEILKSCGLPKQF